MVKKTVQVFFIILLSLIVLFMGVMFLAFHGKDVVKFHKSYFYMNNTQDMESEESDSIPQNTLVISREKKEYDLHTIVLYKNENDKYVIGKISEIFLESGVEKVKITVAITEEFEDAIPKKDIVAECEMYNANLFKFFSLLTSMEGVVGFIILPALILLILVVILIAQSKGIYGKEEEIPATNAKIRVKKESLKDNFGANSTVKMPNKIKVSTVPDPTPEQIAKAAFEKSKQQESFVKIPDEFPIPKAEKSTYIPKNETVEPAKDPVRIIKVKENEPDIEIVQDEKKKENVEVTQLLKPPYIRTQPKPEPPVQPDNSSQSAVSKPETSSAQTLFPDSFSELLKAVEDLEKDLEENK
jgi:hypothetical protein